MPTNGVGKIKTRGDNDTWPILPPSVIQPEPVVFNEVGHYHHSCLDSLGEEYTDVPFTSIPFFDNYEVECRRWDEDDAVLYANGPDQPADFRNLSEIPTVEGFVLLSLDEDEDGPRAAFIRRKGEAPNA